MAILAAREIPAFDGDIVVYALLGVAALVVGGVLVYVSSRLRATGETAPAAPRPPEPRQPVAAEPRASVAKALELEPEPVAAEPPLQAPSPVVERLRADVQRWGKPSS